MFSIRGKDREERAGHNGTNGLKPPANVTYNTDKSSPVNIALLARAPVTRIKKWQLQKEASERQPVRCVRNTHRDGGHRIILAFALCLDLIINVPSCVALALFIGYDEYSFIY